MGGGQKVQVEGQKAYSGVALANQTEESEVRELSGKESGIGPGTPFLRGFCMGKKKSIT